MFTSQPGMDEAANHFTNPEGQKQESGGAALSPETLARVIRRAAHDLNNTLTVIQGNAELARSDLSPQHPAWESVVEIREAGIKAREKVRFILDVCHQFCGEPKTSPLGQPANHKTPLAADPKNPPVPS